MKRFIPAIISALLLFGCSSKQIEQVDILIQHANVIDVNTGKVSTDMSLGIRNDSIVYIGGGSSNHSAMQTIDATGKYVIPGLWDMHVHFRGGDELIAENKNLLPLFIANGITGVREAGGDMTSEIFKWQSEIENGSLIGPKIYTSGPKLDGPRATWAGSIPVVTKEDAVIAIDSLEQMNVDFIKLYDSRITKEAYIWILEEAERRGIRTSGHMPFTVMLEDAVTAGLGSVEHLYYILKGSSSAEQKVTDDNINRKAGFWGSMTTLMDTYSEEQAQKTFKMLVDNDTYVTPTMHIGNTLSYLDRDDHSNDEYLQYIGNGIIETYQGRIRSAARASEDFVAMRHRLNTAFKNLVPKMSAAGVSLLAGSDSGASNSYTYQGISLHQELAALVEAGLSPLEALKAATINGAKFLRVEDFYGSLEVGKSGDILILDDNPLDDITNTQKINTLVLHSKTYSSADLKAMLDSMEK
ncbi:amidohydrolase family protein [Roseivirga sp. E12]|uniref:amidohydrolase family protein n=1 Tax=Roseivirga sp. E12 TaxID=2819237 RepID=UPI001ABD0B0E|nr:amidohydrolase family protein [Roseivirga sp. E12]MBO3698622.1 amidohydrolase family protein [Roseivirga sp. E12]